MRRLLVASLLIAGGCRQVFGIHDPTPLGDGSIGGDDAPIDVIDSAPGPGCYGSPITICLETTPLLPAMFGTTVTIDTDQNPLCRPYTSPQNVSGCVIAGSSVALNGGTLHVTGSKPLIVVSTSTMVLASNAEVDVASHIGGSLGPGANAAACPAAAAPPSSLAGTSGGGAGGSFGGMGGPGGHGGQGGAGGSPAPVQLPPNTLRGGCPGTTGAGATGGGGGAGGGAILLIADSIQIDGTLDASGAAGSGGVASGTGGGGGGGSGGLIVFEASSLTLSLSAKVFASGAGGGEGAGASANGRPGNDPTGPATGALGGTGGTANAGDGGSGSYAAIVDGGPAGSGASQANGGGGGGAAGYVIAHAPTQSIAPVTIAPPITP